MSEVRTLQGLNCPRCGGTVPIPEGHAVVICPYCDLRAFVKGERGARRYQLLRRIDRQTASSKLGQFLSSNMAIAMSARSQAQLTEAFLAYIPFWTMWARALGWVFGQEKKGSGKNTRWVAREVKITEDMTWNGAACDVGEFGVNRVPLTLSARELAPFDAEALHAEGLVFEPVNSMSEARNAAAADFAARIQQKSGLDRVAQTLTRFVNQSFGVVYYPLWVLRYLFRGRAYQVVVDGHSGDVLYGKAPGNTLYRAAMLVGGMALGALLSVDVTALILFFALNANGDDGEGPFVFALVVFAAGLAIMWGAYRAFRYGEVYEYQRYRIAGQRAQIPGLSDLQSIVETLQK